jgi:hypothetical protein
MVRARFKFASRRALTAVLVAMTGAAASGQQAGTPERVAQVREESLGSAPAGFYLVGFYENGSKALYSTDRRIDPRLNYFGKGGGRIEGNFLTEGGQRFDDMLVDIPISTSPDQHHLAFVMAAKPPKNRPPAWNLVYDGKVIDLHADEIKGLTFSPDGSHLACVMATNPPKGGPPTWNLVYDGKVVDFHADEIKWLTFSPDSSQLAFAVRRGTKWQMSNPNKPDNPICDYVSEPVFDPEGRHLAYYSTVGYILDGRVVLPNDRTKCMSGDSPGGPQPSAPMGNPGWLVFPTAKETGPTW